MERVVGHGPGHKKEVVPKKKTLFRQEEKDVPDLLEAIMRPTDPVKKSYGKICSK